mmetsp:Transcript_22800/g.43835  ORF Transcript_22800/g.43835 Transcript_22800/m.43835 type:complete len:226 (-) Transcript_22800:100-777(-)
MAKVAPAQEEMKGTDFGKWEPIVFTFDYQYNYCREPCIFPCCCCCCCCYHPLSCCKDQQFKVDRVHDAVFAKYAEEEIFGKGTIAPSFKWERYEGGFKCTEIFRNIESAEAYYSHFMKDKMFVCWVITNLPWRQKKGKEAVHGDGNVKAWVTNPARLADGPQTVKYNHLKIDSNPGGVVEVVEWKLAPTVKELEEQFGKFHYGWSDKPSVAPTDDSETAPTRFPK